MYTNGKYRSKRTRLDTIAIYLLVLALVGMLLISWWVSKSHPVTFIGLPK